MTEKDEKQDIPYINRTVGNRKYTVVIHFKKGEKEDVKEKVKKLMRMEIKNQWRDKC